MAFTWNPDSIRYVRVKDKTTGVTKELIYGEATCKHADPKPTEDIYNGASVIESDTGDVYFFDMDTSTWNTL